jgi:hypothetical protein
MIRMRSFGEIRMRSLGGRLAAMACLTLIPVAASAQTGLAGVVKDTTGAVLPGVSVEAASPALIEKTRNVVTDEQGQYKIIDLQPGVYTVTFTLTGFSPVKREGIELTTNFTANVNADLRVGSVEETVTVSGSSPTVDVQNVIQQRVINTEVIDTIPSGRTEQTLAALIPGMQTGLTSSTTTQDVGGSAGDMRQTLAIHGSRATDFSEMINGIPQNSVNGWQTGGINMDTGAIQEFSYELAGVSAERTTGGVLVNQIPKAGGNRFSGSVFGAFTNQSLQADNTSADLIARGLTANSNLQKVWDLNPNVGGPILQDRLWFFGSTRYWGYDNKVATYYNLTPTAFAYTADLSRQAIDDSWLSSGSLDMTWQATSKSKISAFVIDEGRCLCHRLVSTTISPEATVQQRSVVDHLAQVVWTAPMTSRLLFEAGVQAYVFHQPSIPQPGITPDIISTTEQSTGLLFRAGVYSEHDDYTYNVRAAVSYVTGSHAFKFGFTDFSGHRVSFSTINSNVQYALLNGAPRSITENGTPFQRQENLNMEAGLYAQDQWTVSHLTINAGIRFDHLNESVPAQQLPAVEFLGARTFAAVPNVPNWNDLSPRLGVSYDLFGNGKTALKATLNRYVTSETLAFAQANDPVLTSVNSATRTWTDSNRNYVPDCDLLNPLANGECGQLNNLNFGKSNITTTYDNALRSGRNVRPADWETSVGIQHELLPNVSMNVTYFRRWYVNFQVTENTAVSPADFNSFCITAPADPRLPGGGGNQICGLYDVSAAKFGQTSNFVTLGNNVGSYWEHYNGADMTMSARLSHGVLLQGGVNLGRSEVNACGVMLGRPDILFTQLDIPVQQAASTTAIESRTPAFCDIKPPFQPQLKLLGSYPLPLGFKASAAFQSVPGPLILATQAVTSAQILPSLGRNLSAGANATESIDLVPPGTLYGDRTNQLDLRLSRFFKFGTKRLNGNVDIYNILNRNAVQVQNNTFGPSWQNPSTILGGRLFKFSGQLIF